MARIAAILRVLSRLVWRDVRTFDSFVGNNFILVFVLVLLQPEAAGFFLLLLAALFLLPISGEPIRKIPPERMGTWPLSAGERAVLWTASLWLSPVTWIVAGLVVSSPMRKAGLQLLGYLVAFQLLLHAITNLGSRFPQLKLFSRLPFPPGRWGGLVLKNLRQMTASLDTWLAGILAIAAILFRAGQGEIEAEAFQVMALLVVVALSTYTQCLFGLDGRGGFTRYRMLPLRGWQILAAKDAAWLIVVMVFVLPLSPVAGLSAALTALAVGHHRAVVRPYAQQRWRFPAGALIPFGFFQTLLSVSAGTYVMGGRLWFLAVIVAVWIGSVMLYGWAFEQQEE